MAASKSWTWRHAILKSDLPPTTRHVLLTISCFMNDVGQGCYPSHKDLARTTGLTDRAIRKHVKLAYQSGYLEIKEHGFRGREWRNYEYSPRFPQPQDVVGAAENVRNEVPHVSADVRNDVPQPLVEGAERGSGEVRNEVPLTSPYTSPNKERGRPARSAGRQAGRQNLDVDQDMVSEILNLWNDCAERVEAFTPAHLTPGRSAKINGLLNIHHLETIRGAVERAERTPFCQGMGRRGWILTFDRFVDPEIFTKLCEGAYDDADLSADCGQSRRSRLEMAAGLGPSQAGGGTPAGSQRSSGAD